MTQPVVPRHQVAAVLSMKGFALTLSGRRHPKTALGSWHCPTFKMFFEQKARCLMAYNRVTPTEIDIHRSANVLIREHGEDATLDQPYRSGITGLTTHRYLASLNLVRSHTS